MKANINFDWKYVSGFKKEYLSQMPEESLSVDIPHSPVVHPENYFSEEDYQGIYTYEKHFDKPTTDDTRFELVFEGIMLKAHIYLNGKDLGSHISGFFRIQIDITEAIKEKNNRLVVVVDSREDGNIPPFGKVVDYLTFSGIYRPVYLLSHKETYFRRLDILKSDQKGNLLLRPDVSTDKNNYRIRYRIYDNNNTLILETGKEEIQIKNPNLWDLNSPYLYRLVASLIQDGKEVDREERSIGFRDYEFRKDGFYLNGKKKKLIGLNRHQTYPELGCAMPKAGQIDDANILKYQCGCNIVRTSHYPQSEDFLNECDRIGLLVQTEVPGWQYVSKDNQTWRENFLIFIKKMVEKEMNHPCILSYGIRVDESIDDDKLYSKAIQICKSIDPNRATTGVRNFKTSSFLEDYYSYNDFSCSNLRHGLDKPSSIKAAKGKPILISENMGHMYPTKQYDEPERRLEHALRHLRVLNDAYKYDYMGEIGWCAFDYNTHKDFGSNDHICYHGIMDIYRNPKAAFYSYQSQNSKNIMMEVINPYQAGDYDECRILPLYVLTNVEAVRLYKNDRLISTFYPDKKDYPDLPHPPIVIDDFIGETFDEGFSRKESRLLVKTLNYVGRVGVANMRIGKVIHSFLIAMSHGKNMDDFTQWYSKYVTCWGSKSSILKIVGLIDGKEVIQKEIGPSTKFHYKVTQTKKELKNEETYDVSRISVFYLDEYENQCHYAFKSLKIDTDGPIQIMGRNEVILKGGDASFYIRSNKTRTKQEASCIIHTDEEDIHIRFIVG